MDPVALHRALADRKPIEPWASGSFARPQSDDERAIKAAIDAYKDQQAAKFEEKLFKQRKRFADTERTLQSKSTKKALDGAELLHVVERRLARRSAPVAHGLDHALTRLPSSQIITGTYEPGHIPPTRGATTFRASGRTSSATRTASSWSRRFTRT